MIAPAVPKELAPVAEQGGGFNPANFYLGVVELFAIILPGAMLTFLLGSAFPTMLSAAEQSSRHLLDNAAFRAIGFVVISYVIGHFLAALGYFVMDPIFDIYYLSDRAQRLRTLATRARATVNGIIELGDTRDEQIRWTLAYISLYSPQASTRLDSLEADCKFFRNLSAATLLSFLLIDSLYYSRCEAGVTVDLGFRLFLIIAFLFLVMWHRWLSPATKRSPSPLRWALVLLILLWPVPTIIDTKLCGPANDGNHIFVDAGLYVFMLLAGMRYLALNTSLMNSAYEFLILLSSKRPEAVISREASAKQ